MAEGYFLIFPFFDSDRGNLNVLPEIENSLKLAFLNKLSSYKIFYRMSKKIKKMINRDLAYVLTKLD